MLVTMTRNEITEQIVAARLAKGLTWQELADAIDRPVVWTTSALLGQHPIPAELGKVLVEMLGLDETAVPVLAARDDGGEWMRRLRDAALMDENGIALDGALKTIATL